ncbi:efflux RND transporter periplasmic adaptor subunit [Novosphingobium album (ex Liu et al. 2023)]|uniref:Efflux RND transporter periplasmic adaptor subunit n=1 Tax=Novosphingobium album (ex Liu et al. 2023) TaxID=3031130 RepID=A0ABT5WVZ3_9SPHN|nr:efflux RND transporter periplasmic adaptor subunit [Novosphingobium album (ex Liu et al. 2023)]MDE8654038.1 efflux RND transporter periplasmic adaptor subunit [Novosphingobium album (ex Liu et al. 2023)]
MSRPGWIVLLMGAAALAACGGDADKAREARPAAGPALVVRPVSAPRWTSVSAEVATVDQAQVLARIPGILTALSVKAGDTVEKGQAIGRIVDSQLGYQSGAYGAQAAAAQAQAAQAQAELARARYLYQNGVYAKARLEQAQAMASAAQAQVSAARQQQQAVNAVAGQGAVIAPASGRVLAADIPAGSPVAPGMVIATITSGPVIVRLDMPESLADKVHPGAAVVAQGVDGTPGESRGTVMRVYPAVNAGQVRADVMMSGIDSRLIGRRVAARVESGTRTALLVPQGYVSTRYGIDYVTLRGRDGALSAVPVQTAPADLADRVEILSGVAAGDRLVPPASAGAGK